MFPYTQEELDFINGDWVKTQDTQKENEDE